MHHIDIDKAYKEKARQELHNNATSHIEQILKATSHKATDVRPPTSHSGKYPWERYEPPYSPSSYG